MTYTLYVIYRHKHRNTYIQVNANMKKIYTSPSVEVHTINAIQMIANSIDKDSQGITNPDDYDFLGREDSHDPKSPNIWDKEW